MSEANRTEILISVDEVLRMASRLPFFLIYFVFVCFSRKIEFHESNRRMPRRHFSSRCYLFMVIFNVVSVINLDIWHCPEPCRLESDSKIQINVFSGRAQRPRVHTDSTSNDLLTVHRFSKTHFVQVSLSAITINFRHKNEKQNTYTTLARRLQRSRSKWIHSKGITPN